MKRCLRVTVILLVAVGLASCSFPALKETTPPPTQTVSPAFSPLPSITPYAPPYDTPEGYFRSQAPFPTYAPPTDFVAGTDIPDIFSSKDDTIVNSNYTLYEDEKYIYYLDDNFSENWGGVLYLIDKGTKSVKRITDKECHCFTVNNGIVYYSEASAPVESFYGNFESYYNIIKSYDTSANSKQTIITLKFDVYSMAACNNKLYFSYVTKNAIDPVSDLYIMNLDGTGKEMIHEDVWTFCIYKNVIYHTGCDFPDGGPLYKCNIDGSGGEGITDIDSEYFYISDNRLFYDSGYIDLKDDELTDTAYDTIDPSMTYSNYAPFGQYFIYNNSCYFYLYDFESGETAGLTQAGDTVTDSYYNLHPTKDNIYYSVPGGNGIFDLYQLVIKNGKASMKPVVSCKALPAKINAPDAAPSPAPAVIPSPDLSQSGFAPDTDIPDIFSSTVETAANSNYTLYENGDYIYYLCDNYYQGDSPESINALFRIDKRTGVAVVITDKGCSCFTAGGGIVYYTEMSSPDEGIYNVIRSYDPITDKKKTIKIFDYDIYGMAAYGSRLYFSFSTGDGESYLYAMNTDGSGIEEIAEFADTFCIYEDTIYISGEELLECDLDGGGLEGFGYSTNSEYFDVSSNRLFDETGYIDLDSGVSKDVSYSEFALYGKYLICNNYADSADTETCYFYMYDFETGRTYDLTQVDNIDSDLDNILYTSKDNIYFSTASDDGSFVLYRLVISGGKASFEKTAELAGGTN